MDEENNNSIMLKSAKHPFWLGGNTEIRNIAELKSVLETIDDGLFLNHVNDKKHDFANWIKHSIEDHDLAEQINEIKDKEELIKFIENIDVKNEDDFPKESKKDSSDDLFSQLEEEKNNLEELIPSEKQDSKEDSSEDKLELQELTDLENESKKQFENIDSEETMLGDQNSEFSLETPQENLSEPLIDDIDMPKPEEFGSSDFNSEFKEPELGANPSQETTSNLEEEPTKVATKNVGEEKVGFFKRLFGRKNKEEKTDNLNMKPLEMPTIEQDLQNNSSVENMDIPKPEDFGIENENQEETESQEDLFPNLENDKNSTDSEQIIEEPQIQGIEENGPNQEEISLPDDFQELPTPESLNTGSSEENKITPPILEDSVSEIQPLTEENLNKFQEEKDNEIQDVKEEEQDETPLVEESDHLLNEENIFTQQDSEQTVQDENFLEGIGEQPLEKSEDLEEVFKKEDKNLLSEEQDSVPEAISKEEIIPIEEASSSKTDVNQEESVISKEEALIPEENIEESSIEKINSHGDKLYSAQKLKTSDASKTENVPKEEVKALNIKEEAMTPKEEITQAIIKHSQKKKDIQKEKKNLQKEKEDAGKEKETLQNEKEDLLKEKENVLKEKEDILKEKEDIANENKDIKKEIKKLTKEFKNIKDKKVEGDEVLKDLKNQLKKKDADFDKIKVDFDKKQKELEDYEKKIKENEEKLKIQEELYHKNKTSYSNLKRKLDNETRDRENHLKQFEKDFEKKNKEAETKIKEFEKLELELQYKEKDLIKNEESLNKKEAEIKDKEVSLNTKEKKVNRLFDEARDIEKELDDKEKGFMKKEVELEGREKVLKSQETKLEKKEKELNKSQADLMLKEKELNIADNSLDYAMKEYSAEKTELEDEEFHKYLHEKLSQISDHDEVMKESVKLTGEPSNYIGAMQKVMSLINECKDVIASKDLDKAKQLYNDLRNNYYEAELSNEDKEMVHNFIRELYDEINIGLLNN